MSVRRHAWVVLPFLLMLAALFLSSSGCKRDRRQSDPVSVERVDLEELLHLRSELETERRKTQILTDRLAACELAR